ncbi:accessory factor UbiK family protein [Granulosicoccaceae sp. 1_MG-2023]|nr:accessory factor UbiK family protein [Granulosicoccaceae sp. 1_MG-2023]
MIDARIFDEMADKMAGFLPPGVSELRGDFERNAKAVMQSTLSKMDLVSREDYEVQTALLQKSMQRLKELEARVGELESQLQNRSEA